MEIIGYELLNEIEGFDCKKGDIIKNKDYFPLYKNNKDFKPIYKETMEKKIIGYKLIKPEYEKAALKIAELISWGPPIGDFQLYRPDCIERIKKTQVLDLWFEPVYEEEFKVGDWVTVIKWSYANIDLPQTCKLEYIEPLRNLRFGIKLQKDHYGNSDQMWYFDKDEFRKATPEEIEAATTIRIKGHDVIINNTDLTVRIGCKTFDYDDVRSVIKVINAGLKVEDSEQIKKLWYKIK